MNIERSIYLVKGYQKKIYPSNFAYNDGLRKRFAIVLNTFYPEKGEMFFDSGLFVELLTVCCKVIDHDSMLIQINEHEECSSLETLIESISIAPEDDREPPLRIKFMKRDQLTCFEETEFWVNCGGPFPYHDSYTSVFYTKDDKSGALIECCTEVCRELGVKIIDIIEGIPEKEPWKPWWKRLLVSSFRT